MKLIRFTILFLFVDLFFYQCDKQTVITNDETNTEIKLLWTSTITDGNLANGVFYNHIHNDRLYVLGSKDNKPTLLAKNVNNGETVWEWSDWGSDEPSRIYDPVFTDDERMLIFANLNYYDISIPNESTLFNEYSDDFFYVINSVLFDDFLYQVGQSGQSQSDSIFYAVYRRNIITNELEEYVLPNYTRETRNLRNEVGIIMRLTGVQYNGKQKLLLSMLEIDSTWNSLGYISLYDIESQSWDYNMKDLGYVGQGNITADPIVNGEFVYHTFGTYATCHNILTGNLVWERNLEVGTSIGGFVISEEDNIMVVSTHSGERLTYGLDMTTGDIVWETETTGGNGQKYALNGVVYFASYGDGELHALDIATGDYIWKIESPDSSSNNWFQGVLTGIPGENGEKGKIFTNSYTNVFCFEAAR